MPPVPETQIREGGRERPSWRDKPLHRMNHQHIEKVANIKKKYQWLEKAGLRDSTELLILAAQKRALNTI